MFDKKEYLQRRRQGRRGQGDAPDLIKQVSSSFGNRASARRKRPNIPWTTKRSAS